MAVPALMPSTSGLAMGLAETRCTMVPATASITPAAPAASTRAPRHAPVSAQGSSNGQFQPCTP